MSINEEINAEVCLFTALVLGPSNQSIHWTKILQSWITCILVSDRKQLVTKQVMVHLHSSMLLLAHFPYNYIVHCKYIKATISYHSIFVNRRPLHLTSQIFGVRIIFKHFYRQIFPYQNTVRTSHQYHIKHFDQVC